MIGFPKADLSHLKKIKMNQKLKSCFEKQKNFYLENKDFFSKKNENWKYFPFQELQNYQWDVPNRKTFSDTKSLSPYLPDSLMFSINKAQWESPVDTESLLFCSWSDFLEGKVQIGKEKTEKIISVLQKKRNPFCSLSNIYGEGFILIVKKTIPNLLEIHYTQNSMRDFQSFHLRNFIFIEEKAQAQILEVFHADKNSHALCFNIQNDSFLSKETVLEHTRLDQMRVQDTFINQYFTDLSSLSQAYFVSLSLNSGLSRWYTELNQKEKSLSEVRGLTLLKDKRQANHKVSVRHQGYGSVSCQNYKSFLFDSAKQIFQGLISIEKQAQKSDAKQLSQNFLFGRGALAVAIPELDVSADDVQARHGAVLSCLKENKDKIFYLQSRGLDFFEAFYLVLSGLVEDSLSCLKGNMRKAVKPFVEKKMRSFIVDIKDFFV